MNILSLYKDNGGSIFFEWLVAALSDFLLPV